jgi:hypothetical protein
MTTDEGNKADGDQATITSGGGDVAGRDIDKREGVFVSGGTVFHQPYPDNSESGTAALVPLPLLLAPLHRHLSGRATPVLPCCTPYQSPHSYAATRAACDLQHAALVYVHHEHNTLQEEASMASQPTQQQKHDYTQRIAVALGGLVIFTLSIWFIQGIIARWQTTSLWSSIPTLVMGLCYTSTSIAMLLAPFYHVSPVKRIALLLLWPLERFVQLGYYFMFVAAPIITLFMVFGIAALSWAALQYVGILPPIAAKAFLYLILGITALSFTYGGDKLVALFLRMYDKQWDFSRLLRLLRPNRVRVYVYGVLAISYVIANIERFSGFSLVPIAFWHDYKDVLVEVLLTIGVFDAVLTIWRERHKDEA